MHRAHAESPEPVWYAPAPHRAQLDAPNPLWYVPAPQRGHTDGAPEVVEKAPTAHGRGRLARPRLVRACAACAALGQARASLVLSRPAEAALASRHQPQPRLEGDGRAQGADRRAQARGVRTARAQRAGAQHRSPKGG